MKALSLTQPWAWLVIHGGKNIENRRWNTKLRGEFLIHAAKDFPVDQYNKAIVTAMGIPGTPELPPPYDIPCGGIVGIASLVDVIPPSDLGEAYQGPPWHFPDQYGLVLEDVHELPFVPCKGALSFWSVPPNVLAMVER